MSNDPCVLAKEYFGITVNPYEAGFIDKEGDLLDLSGKKFGGPANMRSIDHTEAKIATNLKLQEYQEKCNSIRFALHKSIEYGSIMYIDILDTQVLTYNQNKIIKKVLDEKNVKWIELDVAKVKDYDYDYHTCSKELDKENVNIAKLTEAISECKVKLSTSR